MEPANVFLGIAVEAATLAGAVQKESLWKEHRIDFKGGVTNLVTEVDRECEDLIVARIRESFPDHDFVAEENDYGLHGSRFRWVIDPLDGTTNYAHGFPWFCVSIALEVDGIVEVAVINHPMMGEIFTAEKGRGAFLNGDRISVSDRKPMKLSLLATGFPYDRSDGEDNFRNFVEFQVAARAVRRAGAAALDLAYVAAGRFEGFWESKLKPWDTAAGRLLVEEAGGKVTNFAGDPYSIYDHRIVASNGLIHGEMLAVLKGN
jgi:myo-inositol-1(or 4)-monophosphatase